MTKIKTLAESQVLVLDIERYRDFKYGLKIFPQILFHDPWRFQIFSPNLGVRYPFKFEKLAKVVVLIWPDSDMARLTFFPCEITQKKLFSSTEFSYPGNSKKNCHPVAFCFVLGQKELFWEKIP